MCYLQYIYLFVNQSLCVIYALICVTSNTSISLLTNPRMLYMLLYVLPPKHLSLLTSPCMLYMLLYVLPPIHLSLFIPPATKLGGVYWIHPVCPSVCLLPFRVRPVASTVQDGFFPCLVQMINSMRGCVACDDL